MCCQSAVGYGWVRRCNDLRGICTIAADRAGLMTNGLAVWLTVAGTSVEQHGGDLVVDLATVLVAGEGGV